MVLAASSPLIVTLGPVDEAHDIATVIDAFALLRVEMPSARMVIAGAEGAEPVCVREYASERAPGAHIELAGEPSAESYAELLRSC